MSYILQNLFYNEHISFCENEVLPSKTVLQVRTEILQDVQDPAQQFILQDFQVILFASFCLSQGRIQDFLKGGSESGVDIEGGANPSIVSLKQGV